MLVNADKCLGLGNGGMGAHHCAFLRASLFSIRVKEDIPTSSFAVLVDDKADLAGLQLWGWPGAVKKIIVRKNTE